METSSHKRHWVLGIKIFTFDEKIKLQRAVVVDPWRLKEYSENWKCISVGKKRVKTILTHKSTFYCPYALWKKNITL